MQALGTKGYIGKNRALKKLGFGKLEEHTHTLAELLEISARCPDLNAINQHRAAGRPQQTIKMLDQRRLAGAGYADESRAGALSDLQSNID